MKQQNYVGAFLPLMLSYVIAQTETARMLACNSAIRATPVYNRKMPGAFKHPANAFFYLGPFPLHKPHHFSCAA
jgi:hypothetical protein